MTRSLPAVAHPRAPAAAHALMLAWLTPAVLYLVALAVRLAAASFGRFPITEDGAYYVGAARQLVEGHGLTTLALWSYSTPPLELPRPAFELWMPMASFMSAIPMSLLGTSFAAAQWGAVLLGSLIAPLTWWVARDACQAVDLPADRAIAVSVGSGLVAATLGALVMSAADPDSTTPFLIFGTTAAMLLSRALAKPSVVRGALFGVTLGLAYLSRQEAVWIAVTALVLLVGRLRAAPVRTFAARLRLALAWLAPVVAGGLLVVVPWLLRQWLSFGTPVPGQALENALHIRNEDIFAWLDRPSLERFLDQGLATILGHVGQALVHQVVEVIVASAFPVGIVGLVVLVATRRSPALRRPTAVLALVVSGLLTFVAGAVIFPIATLWGTYRHSAGPFLVALIVLSMLWLDGAVIRLGARRGWERSNSWLAPIIVLILVGAMLVVQARAWGQGSERIARRVAAVAAQLAAMPEVQAVSGDPNDPARRAAVMTDRAMWLANELGRPTIALPDEPMTSVASLAQAFDVRLLVVLDQRGRYPDALLTGGPQPCLAAAPERIGPADDPAWLFRIDPACATP
jgi:hypothetical protein